MANAACIGGGSQDAWLTLSAQEILSAFGYPYDQSDPLAATYPQVAAKNNPYVKGSKWYQPFNNFAEACMRARAVLFCNSSPGDCEGGQVIIGADNSTSRLVGTIGNLGIQGAQIGGELAGLTGAALGTLGAVTAGAGFVLSAVISAFQQHAQAVARQATALCELAPEMSGYILQIDGAVQSGEITIAQAQGGIAQLATAFQNAIASLEKNCNAFCMYRALIQCVSDITPFYYQAVAPLASAPSSPAIATQAPVIVPTVTPAQQATPAIGQSVNTSPIPSGILSGSSFPSWLLFAAAAVLLFLLVV